MTVDKLGDNKLLIKLDESDMENFELDFGKMSFKNEDNQKVIIGLMRLACCRAGLDTNGKNVKIEAFLLGDECCILVTANPKKRKYRLKKSDSGLCWKMANASDFLNAVEALYRSNICCRKSSAYEMSGNYYLVFDYFSLPKHMVRVLSEYGERQKSRNGIRSPMASTSSCRVSALWLLSTLWAPAPPRATSLRAVMMSSATAASN